MTPCTTFHLTRNGFSVVAAALGSSEVVSDQPYLIEETARCGFEVRGREPDMDYRAGIGDYDIGGAEAGGNATSSGVARGTDVLWCDAAYFDNQRHRVWVTLESRPVADEQGKWVRRVRMPVHVEPTKLSGTRYEGMLAQLRGLAAGLLFDLVSKMLRSVGFVQVTGRVSSRSNQLELRLVERLWGHIAPALQSIADNPARQIGMAWGWRRAWGGERMGAASLTRLAHTGIDPRRRETPRPFRLFRGQLTETAKTLEHRILLAMLQFLEERVRDCSDSIGRHRHGLESDMPMRNRAPGAGPSLYATEDMPRLRRLEAAHERAHRLLGRIQAAQRAGPWRGLEPSFAMADTPVFRHVEPYRRCWLGFHQYLQSSLVILDDGFEERLKSTSRMYEQWVFFQVAAAFRRAGLVCGSMEGLFSKSRRFCFTLDVDRGARLAFPLIDGRTLSLRFEPWILPLPTARQRRDTLFHGKREASPWSPDIVIELLNDDAAEGLPPSVAYLVVVDAKYSKTIRQDHWDQTGKYLGIRTTRTSAQIGTQLWLVFPRDEQGLESRDGVIDWTDDGPNCDRTERTEWLMGMSPPALDDAAEAAGGWITEPCQNAQRFVNGLLRFLGVSTR